MRKGLIIGLLVLVSGAPAAAQELKGLDLSAPQPPPEKKPSATEVAPLTLEPEPARPATPAKGEAAAPAGGLFGATDVALGDKVKAVQRKGVLKRGRFEVAPVLSLSINDPFYEKAGGGLRLAYSLQDSFALALRGTYYQAYRTDNVREGKVAFQSQLLTSQLTGTAMLDGVWSPIYGKAAFLADSIVHFDVYLAAGLGAAWSATSEAPRNEGPHPAAEVGGGVRFYPKEWMAWDFGVMATFYPDQPMLSVPATMQKVFVANVGVSFFFPLSYEYVYPQ